jgi:hypothetical protein
MENYAETAKKLLKQLNAPTIKRYEHTDDALELIREFDCENGNFDIVDDSEIEYIVESEMKKGGWERVYFFLSGASVNAPYGHRIDAYGNLADIEFDDIKFWLEEIASN